MTGHQQNPTTGFNLKGDPCTKIDLEALCHAVGIRRVQVVDPYDLAACDKAIKEELDAEDSDAEYMALDLKTKLEWIANVLEIAEENEGLGA